MTGRVPPQFVAASATWLLGSIGAWIVGYPLLGSPPIVHPRQILPYAVASAGLGVLVGIILGLAASLAFGRFLDIRARWFVATSVGMPVGLGFAYVLSAITLLAQVHRLGMSLTGEGGGATMSPPAPLTLVLAGLLVACVQLPFVARALTPTLQAKALWIIGSCVALGGGWFAAAMLVGAIPGRSASLGALMGLFSGLVILFLVAVLDAERRRPTTR
jgi:hypothetical protein